MKKEELKEIKQKASTMKPQLNIGKQGITLTVIDTINKFLKAHNIMKIKVLSAGDIQSLKEIAEEIRKKTNSELIDSRGFTFVLYKKE